jgi:hypothetical protein
MANPTTAPTIGPLCRHQPLSRLRTQPQPQPQPPRLPQPLSPCLLLPRLPLRLHLLQKVHPRLRLPRQLRLFVSPKLLPAWLLAVGLALGCQTTAQAQIVREKPAQVKAANRRALRDARHTASHYKESHLRVTPAQLKRGQSTQPVPAASDKLEYSKVATPKAKSPGLQIWRRKKKA